MCVWQGGVCTCMPEEKTSEFQGIVSYSSVVLTSAVCVSLGVARRDFQFSSLSVPFSVKAFSEPQALFNPSPPPVSLCLSVGLINS